MPALIPAFGTTLCFTLIGFRQRRKKEAYSNLYGAWVGGRKSPITLSPKLSRLISAYP